MNWDKLPKYVLPERERLAEEFRQWKFDLIAREPADTPMSLERLVGEPEPAPVVGRVLRPGSMAGSRSELTPGPDSVADNSEYLEAKSVARSWIEKHPEFVSTTENIETFRNYMFEHQWPVTDEFMSAAFLILRHQGKL